MLTTPDLCNQLQFPLQRGEAPRAASHLDCEVRFAPVEEDGTVEGFAVTFNTVDEYRTTFDQRAFSTARQTLPLLWSHRPDEVVGSTRSIAVTPEGLKIVGKLNLDVQRAREVRAMLLSGDVRGLSIGFRTLKDERRTGGIRHITQADLREISFVAIPAVPGSRVISIRNASAVASFVSICRDAARSIKGQ